MIKRQSPVVLNGLTEPDEASKRRNASRHLRRTIQGDWAESVLIINLHGFAD